MNEINYQVFDKISGLPFPEFSDSKVRELAHNFNKSYSQAFFDIKEQIEGGDVRYIVNTDSKNIIPILDDSMSFSAPIEYDTYEEALKNLDMGVIIN